MVHMDTLAPYLWGYSEQAALRREQHYRLRSHAWLPNRSDISMLHAETAQRISTGLETMNNNVICRCHARNIWLFLALVTSSYFDHRCKYKHKSSRQAPSPPPPNHGGPSQNVSLPLCRGLQPKWYHPFHVQLPHIHTTNVLFIKGKLPGGFISPPAETAPSLNMSRSSSCSLRQYIKLLTSTQV
jgi:hypothetical protein